MALHPVPPLAWTEIGDTGIEIYHDGPNTHQVSVDDRGAVVLPPVDQWNWAARPVDGQQARVPVFRQDETQPDELPDFEIDNGAWRPRASG